MNRKKRHFQGAQEPHAMEFIPWFLTETYSDLGELVLYERFLGRVVDSTQEEVAVLYKTPEGHLEQTYSHSQFFEGKVPKIGDEIVAFAFLYLSPQKEESRSLAEMLEDDND